MLQYWHSKSKAHTKTHTHINLWTHHSTLGCQTKNIFKVFLFEKLCMGKKYQLPYINGGKYLKRFREQHKNAKEEKKQTVREKCRWLKISKVFQWRRLNIILALQWWIWNLKSNDLKKEKLFCRWKCVMLCFDRICRIHMIDQRRKKTIHKKSSLVNVLQLVLSSSRSRVGTPLHLEFILK